MFKHEFMTMTQIGLVFGVTSHQIGLWLVELGFRTQNKRPSEEAFNLKLVEQVPSRNQGYNWAWRSRETISALVEDGHPLALQIPEAIAEKPKLAGPFTMKSTNGVYQILNALGRPVAEVAGEENVAFLLKLLNGADKVGMIDKHLGYLLERKLRQRI